MHCMKWNIHCLFLTSLVATILVLAPIAHAGIPIQSGHSGSWFDPERRGEGFLLEVVGDQLVAYWFTYDAQGQQQWMFGMGSISGDGQDRANVPVIVTSGAIFGDEFDPNDVMFTNWGTLTFEFDTCDVGTVRYNSIVGLGSRNISFTRLTELRNSACEENAPNVLGTYPQSALGTQIATGNCSDGSQPFLLEADNASLVIDSQAGTDISGRFRFQTTRLGLVNEETGSFEGTVLENGAIQARFETASTVSGEPDGGTIGTFSTLIGSSDSIVLLAQGVNTDNDSVTCTEAITATLVKTQ